MYPERFNNKTNGVTPRRWLLLANPALAELITDAIGDAAWVTDLAQLRGPRAARGRRRVPGASSARPNARPRTRFADWLRSSSGPAVDPDTIFDSQIKRIHEYKRQLLNVLHIVILYNRLRANPNLDVAAADVLLRRQGRAGLPPGQAHHQADQQRRRHRGRRPGRRAGGCGSSSCPSTT